MLSYVIPIYKQKSCMSANPCTNNLDGTYVAVFRYFPRK